ncbi:hypothetical protein [Pedobacter sp. NJ-S-72]
MMGGSHVTTYCYNKVYKKTLTLMKSKKSKKFKAEFLKAVEAYLEDTADEDQILFLEQYFDLFSELDEILESQNIIQNENVGNLMHSRIHEEIKRLEELEKKK